MLVLCSGPETCLLQCCERGVAMESCLCLPESPPGLSGAGCQDPGDEPRLLVPSCLPGTQAPLPPSRGPGCPPLYDGEAGGGDVKSGDRGGGEGLGEPGSCNQPCGPGHVSFQKRLGVAGTSLEAPGRPGVTLGKALEAETGSPTIPHSRL